MDEIQTDEVTVPETEEAVPASEVVESEDSTEEATEPEAA